MGGCCCCASKGADPERTPIYVCSPHGLEENEPLSSPHFMPTAVPVGLLVDTNLETSSPDTYRAPPVPLPYDAGVACPESVTENNENLGNKTDNVDSMNLISDTPEGLKGIGCKGESDSPKVKEDEHSKLSTPFSSPMDEEDVCPTCLEEYDKENPRIITKCEHHFHLSCILEWMERSDTCPVCDQIMMISHTSSEFHAN